LLCWFTAGAVLVSSWTLPFWFASMLAVTELSAKKGAAEAPLLPPAGREP